MVRGDRPGVRRLVGHTAPAATRPAARVESYARAPLARCGRVSARALGAQAARSDLAGTRRDFSRRSDHCGHRAMQAARTLLGAAAEPARSHADAAGSLVAYDSRRAVLVLIDGARHDVLREMLDRGELPNLARWVIEPGGVTTGTTVFPSTTGVAYIPFLFGRYPGSVGIPGIRWLDRRGAAGNWREQWRAARSYCGVQGVWLNRDIAPGPSLFDLVPESIAICTPLTRGLRPGANRLSFRRAALGAAAHYAGTYPALDRAVSQAWLDTASESWRFLFVVFPGVDGISHLQDPFSSAVLESYRLVDRALGAFVARARKKGDLPAFFVVADHGMTTMREHADPAVLLE